MGVPAKQTSPAVELEVDGRTVRISSPDRVYFSARGETKLDLARYYLSVGDGIVRALRERPCMLHRFPDGVDGQKVHQKRLPKGAPDWIQTVNIYFPRFGRTADELCVTELGSVIWAVQMSTVEFHPWNSRCADVERPDEWRIDLDPMPEASFDSVRRVAKVAREVLDEIGAVGWPKTSGGNGLHIYVRIEPRWGFSEVREAALAFAREVERRIPQDATTTWWRKDRDPRKVFVDYNQNARDHTIASRLLGAGNIATGTVSTPIVVGRARRRRSARVHDRDGAGAVRRDRRSARRHRRRGVLARAAARVGGARRRRVVRGRRSGPKDASLLLRRVHDQHVGVRVVRDGLADAGVKQAMHIPVVATDDDQVRAPLLGELDDAVGRLSDGTLILGISDPLRLEILARCR